MGLLTIKFVNAWFSHGSDRRTGRTQAARQRTPTKQGYAASLIALFLTCFAAHADTLRVATWHVELTRKGPGLLLRDIQKDDDQVSVVVQIIDHIAPDVILLTGLDWDPQGITLDALNQKFATAFPHVHYGTPNTGIPTQLDLDGDGYLGGAGDAQGWGRFRGHGSMALLSNIPIENVQDFTSMLWKDQPNALLPEADGALFPSADVYDIQRLPSVAHWDIALKNGLHLLAFTANPPVFDGPEDRNGRRNHDEISFWARHLTQLEKPAIVLGNANLDPKDGEGLHAAIRSLIDHPQLQDPKPASPGGAEAAALQAGKNLKHTGDPALDTADWSDEKGPGNLRVSYVLPGRALDVHAAGVFWPRTDDPQSELLVDGPRHRLVWVDVIR